MLYSGKIYFYAQFDEILNLLTLISELKRIVSIEFPVFYDFYSQSFILYFYVIR